MIILRWIRRWIGECLVLAVRMYQIVLSPLLGGSCRYTPSCSEYFILAVRKYGPLRVAGAGAEGFCVVTHYSLEGLTHRS